MLVGLFLAVVVLVLTPFFKAVNRWVIDHDPKMVGREIPRRWAHPYVIWGTLGCAVLLVVLF